MKCMHCDAELLPVDFENSESRCPECGRRLRRRRSKRNIEKQNDHADQSVEVISRPSKTKRRRRRDSSPAADSFGIVTYVVCTICLLGLWGGLTALHFYANKGTYWLVSCGFITMFSGVGWLYQCALQEGVERFSLFGSDGFSGSGQSLIAFLIGAAMELIFMPIFSLIFFFFHFESAWKPFLIEVLGIGMIATGFVLIFR